MNKQEIIELIGKISKMTEADFKIAAGVISANEFEAKLDILEATSRLSGQALQATKTRK